MATSPAPGDCSARRATTALRGRLGPAARYMARQRRSARHGKSSRQHHRHAGFGGTARPRLTTQSGIHSLRPADAAVQQARRTGSPVTTTTSPCGWAPFVMRIDERRASCSPTPYRVQSRDSTCSSAIGRQLRPGRCEPPLQPTCRIVRTPSHLLARIALRQPAPARAHGIVEREGHANGGRMGGADFVSEHEVGATRRHRRRYGTRPRLPTWSSTPAVCRLHGVTMLNQNGKVSSRARNSLSASRRPSTFRSPLAMAFSMVVSLSWIASSVAFDSVTFASGCASGLP